VKELLYFAPKTMNEALKLLARHKRKIIPLAGGTDLVPKINDHQLRPDMLLYVGKLDLDYIKLKKGKLLIGALTSWSKLASNSYIAKEVSALHQAADIASSIAVKTLGTIGGNLGTASPAADLITPLLVMEAQVCLAKTGGKRLVPLNEFFVGPGETARKPDELIIELQVPLKKGKSVFLRIGRRKAMTLSVANVAVRVEMVGKSCKEARIALGAMAPTPMRCLKAEDMLKDVTVDQDLISKCAAKAVEESKPINDGRASAWYRKKVASVLVSRALAQACSIPPM